MSEKIPQTPIQMEQCSLTEFSFRLLNPTEKPPGEPGMLSLGFGWEKKDSFPAPYRLVLRVTYLFKHQDGALFLVNATIIGFFRFPDETDEKKREELLELNGLSMLYGSLRGLLLSFGGAFPPGTRCLLPTVNVAETVKIAKEKSTAVKPAKRKTSPAPKRKKKTPANRKRR